jgi:hypothetical protein
MSIKEIHEYQASPNSTARKSAETEWPYGAQFLSATNLLIMVGPRTCRHIFLVKAQENERHVSVLISQFNSPLEEIIKNQKHTN